MKLSKKFLISTILISVCSFTFAQTSKVENANTYEEEETSVESDFLNDFAGEALTALAEADDLETKLFALASIRDAIDSGNTSKYVIDALDQLAGEGITSEKRKKGRKTNELPMIRREACIILGSVPTVHTKNTLIRIAKEDKEPTVTAMAVRSLGNIAEEVGCVDEAVDAICFFNAKKDAMFPTSSLALEVLFALEKLAPSAQDQWAIIDTINTIANNYNYNTQTRNYARKLLIEMTNNNSSSDSDDDDVKAAEK